MKNKKDEIIIQDWAGNILFQGDYRMMEVEAVLNANRCECDSVEICGECEGTGYKGDIEIFWTDKNDKRNIYELIDY